MKYHFRILFFLSCLLPALLFAQQSHIHNVFIKAGNILDVRTGKLLQSQGIIIEGDKIKQVGLLNELAGKIPKDAEIIDLGNATVIPGLIDCHTHVTFQSGNYYENLFRKTPIDRAVIANVFAKRTLEAGFTTIRNLGAGEFIDVALRNAINEGIIPGPRMQVSTLGVGSTGGHADLTGFSPYLKFQEFSGIADGVDEIRKLIRFEIKNGADVIKLFATAGVTSEEGSVGAPQFSQEEMNVAVEEAAMWGKKVAAHAHGTEGIKRAVLAGVASIEHGSMLDEECIRLMKQKGTYLVADIYCDDYILTEFKKMGYPDKTIEKEKSIGLLQRENFMKAVKAGVKIAFGTDAGIYPHGWNAKQFKYMVKWGQTPLQAIQSTTINAAELLGWQDKVGAIEPGLYGDIIAVRDNPLDNISSLENIDFVMKGGIVVKNLLSQRK